MRSAREIRKDAWDMLTVSTWGWKIAFNYFILLSLCGGALMALFYVYQSAGIQTFHSFAVAKKAAEEAGRELADPTGGELWRMTLASLFQKFVKYLFSGIAAFGIVATLVKCIKGEDNGLFSAAFGGFRRPLEMFWLSALMTIKVMLWMCLLIIPGFVAAVAYSLAWYIKVENPELGANACLKRSREMLYGRKWALVGFGLSYLGWFFLALFPFLSARVFTVAVGNAGPLSNVVLLVNIVAFVVSSAMILFVGIYAALGQAVFYRDVKAEVEPAGGDTQPEAAADSISG